MMPSTRKVITRAPARTVRLKNLRGLLPAPVEADSTYEGAFAHRAALLPTSRSLTSQPFKLAVSPGGYTPDFLQTFLHSDQWPAVIEIKPEAKIGKYSATFDAAAELLDRNGYRFFVLTEKTLYRDGIDSRARLLRRYAKAVYPPIYRQRMEHILGAYEKGLPIGTLCRKAAVRLEVVYHFIATRLLTTGPNLKIDESAVVRLCSSFGDPLTFDFEQWFGVARWGRGSNYSNDGIS